jgi:hypothetical protein
MRPTLSRVVTGLVLAGTSAWLLDALHFATFAESINGPEPPFHVPSWLEPYVETARLICHIMPGVLLGAIARWRPGFLGFVAGAFTFYCIEFFPVPSISPLSSWAIDGATTRAILWSIGGLAGAYLATRWMPNSSLERKRER